MWNKTPLNCSTCFKCVWSKKQQIRHTMASYNRRKMDTRVMACLWKISFNQPAYSPSRIARGVMYETKYFSKVDISSRTNLRMCTHVNVKSKHCILWNIHCMFVNAAIVWSDFLHCEHCHTIARASCFIRLLTHPSVQRSTLCEEYGT